MSRHLIAAFVLAVIVWSVHAVPLNLGEVPPSSCSSHLLSVYWSRLPGIAEPGCPDELPAIERPPASPASVSGPGPLPDANAKTAFRLGTTR